jgi:TnpA family transposase
MPRPELLAPAQREALMAPPSDLNECIRYYTLSANDLHLISQHRGIHNQLGFAVQLCYLRFPGRALAVEEVPPPEIVGFVGAQLNLPPSAWSEYAKRDQTRREHLQELQRHSGLRLLTVADYRSVAAWVTALAMQTSKGIVLVDGAVEEMRRRRLLLPPIRVIERMCAEAATRARRRIYRTLTGPLTEQQRRDLDALLEATPSGKASKLAWLRQPAAAPSPHKLLGLIERLNVIREIRDFEDYLLSRDRFDAMLAAHELHLAIDTESKSYLAERLDRLHDALTRVDALAAMGQLPDAEINSGGLKVAPLTNDVPEAAEELMRQAYARLPHLKITDLLIEVDHWTGFTRHFTHLKSGEPAKDKMLLLTAILADAINLGLTKMAEACAGATFARLSWLAAWHIRDETYSKALAEIVNYQCRLPFASHWGAGITSSSDGQRFRAGGRGEAAGQVNLRYGTDPSVLFYTHLSDQYAPYHTKVINATVRDATHVLDGLLYHESDLKIEEHYTDTAGFTDHVFALCHLLGFRFAPRIRDLADKRLYVPGKPGQWPALAPLIGGSLNLKLIEQQFLELARLAASIKHGTVTASLILRKLGSYPRQNSLALALRELGRIERTLFTLEWLQNPELRRRVNAGLNKSEAKTRWPERCFLIASASSEIDRSKTNATALAA